MVQKSVAPHWQKKLIEVFRTGPPFPAGWQLKVEARNPVGILDVLVTLTEVIPWTEQSTATPILWLLAGIHPSERASSDGIRSDVRYAYGLLCHFWIEGKAEVAERLAEGLSLWRDILAEISHEHLPVLIEVIKNDVVKEASEEEYDKAFKNPRSILQIHYYLRKRAAELLQPADMPGILADPDLTAKLRPFLPASAVPETAAPQGSPTGSEDQKPDR